MVEENGIEKWETEAVIAISQAKEGWMAIRVKNDKGERRNNKDEEVTLRRGEVLIWSQNEYSNGIAI